MNDGIYCLLNTGTPITSELGNYILKSAWSLLDSKGHKKRLRLKQIELTGEITTRHLVSSIGSVTGILFHVNIDWQDGSTKTDFIVRPRPRTKVRDDELLNKGLWYTGKIPGSRIHEFFQN